MVSADTNAEDIDEDGFHEHAVSPRAPLSRREPDQFADRIDTVPTISHPLQNDFSRIKLFILIYAPGLKESSLDAAANLPPASLSSSFSNIGHDQAQSPKGDAKSPL